MRQQKNMRAGRRKNTTSNEAGGITDEREQRNNNEPRRTHGEETREQREHIKVLTRGNSGQSLKNQDAHRNYGFDHVHSLRVATQHIALKFVERA